MCYVPRFPAWKNKDFNIKDIEHSSDVLCTGNVSAVLVWFPVPNIFRFVTGEFI